MPETHSPMTSGYITSDCDADENVFSQLHFAASAEELSLIHI